MNFITIIIIIKIIAILPSRFIEPDLDEFGRVLTAIFE